MTFQLKSEMHAIRRTTYVIRFPDQRAHRPQDEECCEVLVKGEWRRFRLHDYDAIYNLPGLYEQLFAGRLQCTSPQRLVSLFEEVLHDWSVRPTELRVLEVGAGNGMVGEELRTLGVGALIGVDILPEASVAAQRDRPAIYDDYLVADLCDSETSNIQKIVEFQPNCLTSVAALGFGDIPPGAFVSAYNTVSTPGWIVFNIKESFLTGVDDTGFARLIRRMMDQECIQVQSYRRYCHRLSISGQRLHYVAIVARKLRPVTQSLLESAK